MLLTPSATQAQQLVTDTRRLSLKYQGGMAALPLVSSLASSAAKPQRAEAGVRLQSVRPDEMQCPQCKLPLFQPKILPCAHLLCRNCLVKRLLVDKEFAQCKVCRCLIVGPEALKQKSQEEVADDLPSELAMEALVVSVRKLERQHTCQACLKVPAVDICLNCGDLVCQACSEGHLNMSFARSHKTVSLKELTPEGLAASRPAACPFHSNQACHLFCATHGVTICHLCAVAKHRACADVVELDEKLSEARAYLLGLERTLAAGESELDDALQEEDNVLKKAEKDSGEMMTQIEAIFNRLQKSLEANRRRLRNLAAVERMEVEKGAKAARAILTDKRNRVKTFQRLVERVRLTSPRSCLGDMMCVLKQLVPELLRLPEEAQFSGKAKFFLDHDALDRIEEELSELEVRKESEEQREKDKAECDTAVLKFHVNHGKHVELGKDHLTAEKLKKRWYGLVVSMEAMQKNKLYEVRIDQVNTTWSPSGRVFCGVMTTEPRRHNCSNVVCALNLPNAYVIWDSGVKALGVRTESRVGASLTNVRVGGRVGVLLDAAQSLHLYVNGCDQGVAAYNLAETALYPFFDLTYHWRKVTALPVKTMKSCCTCTTSDIDLAYRASHEPIDRGMWGRQRYRSTVLLEEASV